MFNEFKSGEKGHMAFVQEVNTSGEGDPFYETIGLVTLEDIIEEIIQQEIVDETDVVMDNRTKKKRKGRNKEMTVGGGNFPIMAGDTAKRVRISPQVTLAVFQYLTTSIEPFKNEFLAKVSNRVTVGWHHTFFAITSNKSLRFFQILIQNGPFFRLYSKSYLQWISIEKSN
jgi:hypothetical protein